MKYELVYHGVPRGHQVWSGTLDKYYETFYGSEEVYKNVYKDVKDLMILEIRKFEGKYFSYYTFINYKNVIAEDGRLYEYVLTNKLVYGEVCGIKVDEEGEGLAGATIGIFYPEEEEPFATTVSAEDGSFSFPKVYYGEYVIREVGAPEGFLLDETPYPVIIDEKGAVVEIEITNTRIRGNVQLTKVDADYPDNKLTGAIFEVYQNGELIGTMEELEGGVYQMEHLPAYVYVLHLLQNI
jgi:uncharacterized surface anchored protein